MEDTNSNEENTQKEAGMSDNSTRPFFMSRGIKKYKDTLLKMRLEDTISRCGISKREFYERIGISPAYWWRISWGIDNFPSWLKTKLCDEFGKPFMDFFFINLEVGK